MNRKKQFVWLMTDTTRYDMLGCYGFPAMKTPHLDALAQSGVRFERAYCAQPVCGPARSLLFTGLFPHENGSWGNCMPLGADIRTLGQRLTAGGIPCAYIGKWHLDGGDYFGNGLCPEGWDPAYWYDMKCYLDGLRSDDERKRSRKAVTCYENGGIEADFTYGKRCADRALQYLDAHADQDFFLTVSFDEPHSPALCPEPYASMYADYTLPDTPSAHDDLTGKPLYQKLWAHSAAQSNENKRLALIMGCNTFIDEQLGRIIDKVHAVAPDAVILYTSDHGAAFGAHGLNAKGAAVYDEIARIPLIFSGPGLLAGAVKHGTVSHADLPATVLDFMGLRIPQAFTGKSLLPRLTSQADPSGEAFVEFNRYERDHDGFGGYQPMRAVITDEYKLALHLTDRDELYVLQDDPYDLHNRIDDAALAEVRNRLHDRILSWMNDTRDPFRGYQWQCRPWREELLPGWEVDGYTRQPENEPGEYRQKDYATGCEMLRALRKKEQKESIGE